MTRPSGGHEAVHVRAAPRSPPTWHWVGHQTLVRNRWPQPSSAAIALARIRSRPYSLAFALAGARTHSYTLHSHGPFDFLTSHATGSPRGFRANSHASAVARIPTHRFCRCRQSTSSLSLTRQTHTPPCAWIRPGRSTGPDPNPPRARAHCTACAHPLAISCPGSSPPSPRSRACLRSFLPR